MKIDRPDDLADIADLGLTLAEGKLLLAGVQREIVAAQARRHAVRRPDCRIRAGVCHVKDHRDHAVATLFGQVTVRLPRFRCAGCGGIEAGIEWSNLQNRADSVIFRRRVYGFSETPASVSWYDGVAKRPDTDQDNKDVGDVAEGDTIHILAPYSRRTSSLARRCDGRSAERASPAIRQRARPGSDRDVPAKLARTCRAPTRRACGPGAQLHCQGGVQPADHLPADRHAIGRQDTAPPVRLAARRRSTE